ncbi:MAG: hypothetical protein HY541_06120 [Deltaproteobacteria bacterium]|nr:hypothetical protein [Deltaproteobacteria bacterium]MBI4412040.1 hypothetical protein [Deltaproteobacteria bacterium]
MKKRFYLWLVIAFILAGLAIWIAYEYLVIPCGKPGIYNCQPTPVCVEFDPAGNCRKWEMR